MAFWDASAVVPLCCSQAGDDQEPQTGELIPDRIGGIELGIRGRLAIPVVNPAGSIWMLDNVGR